MLCAVDSKDSGLCWVVFNVAIHCSFWKRMLHMVHVWQHSEAEVLFEVSTETKRNDHTTNSRTTKIKLKPWRTWRPRKLPRCENRVHNSQLQCGLQCLLCGVKSWSHPSFLSWFCFTRQFYALFSLIRYFNGPAVTVLPLEGSKAIVNRLGLFWVFVNGSV